MVVWYDFIFLVEVGRNTEIAPDKGGECIWITWEIFIIFQIILF